MSIYTLIERELIDINEAKFELICNAFISHEYRGDLQSLGMVKGKEKTRKGKPDAFIVQEDGTYVVAEYTTKNKSDNKDTFLKKLQTDIIGCLNFDKLGIKASQVAMVVVCCNSNLSISEVEWLKNDVATSNIRVRIVGIDSLALFLFSKGRYYAHQHLNVPFDTGQILNKSEFLRFYGKRNFATPLNNQFVGRQKELGSLVQLINNHNIVIISGQPGVGKSKLCLEAIDFFLQQQPQYLDYYIVSKTGSLLEDLKGILEHGKKYIFFVDDANRQIGNLLNIIYSSSDNYNVQIKIIITVRNYAKEQVLSVCSTLRPATFHLGKMLKRNIAEIIRERDSGNQLAPYLNRIIEISDGNPRIAIMSAHIVRHEQNPRLLKDVSFIYDQYFQTIVDDKKIFAEPDIIKTLGIISFFYSLDLGSEKLRTLLDDFNMPYEIFIKLVFVLEEAEFVEVYLKNIVRISEQTLATFAFYKAFIQERLLDFDTLLSKYCEKTFTTIKDIMGPVYASFGEKQALDNIKGILIKYFNNHKINFDHCTAFLRVFGTSIPDQALLFVGKHCAQMNATSKSNGPLGDLSALHLSELPPALSILLPIIKNGSGTEIISATALSIIYAEKVPDTYKALLDELTLKLRCTENDLIDDAKGQKAAYNYLHAQLGKSDTGSRIFFNLFRNILLSKFRKRTFYTKTETAWKISAPIMQLRQQFWQDINNCFTSYIHLCRRVIESYITDTPRTSVILLRFDEPYLVEILLSYFRQDSFEDCRLVNEYLDIVGIYYSPSNRLLQLKQHFYNSAVIVFSKLSANNPFKRYQPGFGWERNESKIRSLIIDCMDDFKRTYNLLLESLPYWREVDKMCYTLDFWITSLIERDFDLGLTALQFIIDDGNKIGLRASDIFESLSAILEERYEQIYNLIKQKEFYDSDNWVYEYFSKLKPVASTEYLMHEAMNYFATSTNIGTVYNHHFSNFLCFDEDIHEKILLLLSARVERGDQFNYELSEYFFLDNKTLVKKHFIACKLLYFDLKSSYSGYKEYDRYSTVLFALYEVDSNILFDYLDYLETTPKFTNHEDDRPLLSLIWDYDNAAVNMEKVIIRYKSIQDFEPLGHVCCIFFNYLSEHNQSKVKDFLRTMINKYSGDSKILNIILDIARTCVKDSYMPLVQYFLRTNDDFNIFKSIYWFTSWEHYYDETSLQEAKAFKLSELQDAIKELREPLRFIEHIEHLTQEIHHLQESIAEYRKWDFMEDRHGRSRQKLKYFE